MNVIDEKLAPEKVFLKIKAESCCHHWLIDRAGGLFSRGVCKYCNEERDFFNIIPERTEFNRDKTRFTYRQARLTKLRAAE